MGPGWDASDGRSPKRLRALRGGRSDDDVASCKKGRPSPMRCDALRHTTTQSTTAKRRKTLSLGASREREGQRELVKASRNEMSLRDTGTKLKRSVRNERGANEFRAPSCCCAARAREDDTNRRAEPECTVRPLFF